MRGSQSTRARARAALCVVVLVTFLALPMSAMAQGTGAFALDLPLGIRSNAMGQSGVADRSDPANIFYNPANVTAVDGVFATTSYELLVPEFDNDIWFGHVNLGVGKTLFGGVDNPSGMKRPYRVAFALTLAHLSYGRRRVFTPSGVTDEHDIDEGYFAMTTGFATPLGEHAEWAIGAAFKRWSGTYFESFVPNPGPLDVSAGMFDIGAAVSTAVDASDWRVRPALAVAAVNLGSDIDVPDQAEGIRLPSWFRYGTTVIVDGPLATLGAATVPTLSATMNLDGLHGLEDQRPEWRFGFELEFLRVAAIRFGRMIDDHDRTPAETWGVALGLPAGRFRARVEYASVEYGSDYIYAEKDKFGVMLAWLFDQ